MQKDNGEIDKKNSDENHEPKKVIPLSNTYIWGIVICIAALIVIILYNQIKTPQAHQESKDDYLALLRDNHETAVGLRGVDRIGTRTLPELENQVREQSGHLVIFPDWLPVLPGVEIIGSRISEIGDDQAVNLIFKDQDNFVDFVTIFNTRHEIEELEKIKLEDHFFNTYKWGTFQAFFWEIDEDKSPIIYGVISDMDPNDLGMLAVDTMRSLKMYYMSAESATPQP